MNNVTIVVFSVIISVSFFFFILLTIKEFNDMSKKETRGEKKADTISK
jgi:hypothetical protein